MTKWAVLSVLALVGAAEVSAQMVTAAGCEITRLVTAEPPSPCCASGGVDRVLPEGRDCCDHIEAGRRSVAATGTPARVAPRAAAPAPALVALLTAGVQDAPIGLTPYARPPPLASPVENIVLLN